MKRRILAVAMMLAAASAAAGVVDEIGPATGRPGGGAFGGAAGGGLGVGTAGGPDRSMRESVSLNAVQTAFDEADPRANIKRFRYDPTVTYRIRMREFMDSTVILPPGESVEAFSLADTKNFGFEPFGGTGTAKKPLRPDLAHIFRVWAINPGADTNLTVLGKAGRVYSFYLRADSIKSTHMPALVTYIDDPAYTPPLPATTEKAPKAGEGEKAPSIPLGAAPKSTAEAEAMAEYLRKLPIAKPSDIVFGYSAKAGDASLAPAKIFDDGVWTYFKYGDDNLDKIKRLPVIYRVIDGVDTPVNQRIEAGTIIAETTSAAWTLRSGDAHLCVRKE